jgi:cytoskeletal protein CcmA (bactofilin family)
MPASTSAITSPAPAASAVIGRTVVINGEVYSWEPLTIYGQVAGTIEVGEHLIIASGADVRARINARSLDVQGRVEGEVGATETVIIRNNAEFIGDIHASSLVIEEGGYIKGNIDLGKPLRDTSSKHGTSLSENADPVESHAVLSA